MLTLRSHNGELPQDISAPKLKFLRPSSLELQATTENGYGTDG